MSERDDERACLRGAIDAVFNLASAEPPNRFPPCGTCTHYRSGRCTTPDIQYKDFSCFVQTTSNHLQCTSSDDKPVARLRASDGDVVSAERVRLSPGYVRAGYMQPLNPPGADAAALTAVRTAVTAYHLVLDTGRRDPGSAGISAMLAIQTAIGMPWVRGAALTSSVGHQVSTDLGQVVTATPVPVKRDPVRDNTREPGIVYVCPERDIACGHRPNNWCATCPLRGATVSVSDDMVQRLVVSLEGEMDGLAVEPETCRKILEYVFGRGVVTRLPTCFADSGEPEGD